MENGIKYILLYPIKIKSDQGTMVEISSLTLGRLKAKHLKLVPKGLFLEDKKRKVNFEPHEIIPLIAGLTGITEEDAGELDWQDLFQIAEKMVDLLGELESQKIGKK